MDNPPLHNILWSIGASLIMFGFYRTSFGGWENTWFWYELDNTVGAVLLIAYQLHQKAYLSLIADGHWLPLGA